MDSALLHPLPEPFKQMLRAIPSLDADALISALDTPPSVSIKLNRRKHSHTPVVDCPTTPVSWCESGLYLDQRPKFTLNPLMHAGAFYVQDASSMIYEPIISHCINILSEDADCKGDKTSHLALDACAAPGGKSSSIINALPKGWHIVANEFVAARANILRENLLKWGFPNFSVTNSPVDKLASAGPIFSIAAVDAPCSGEGMMRKEAVARSQWTPTLINQCASLQKEILTNAIDALLPGGFLIFSTCTFNPIENEANLQWLVEDMGMIPVEPPITTATDIPRQICGPYPALRFMPHVTRGEGLFISLLRKPGAFSTLKNSEKSLQKLLGKCHVLANGYPSPILKGRDLIPDGSAPLSVEFDMSRYPSVELSLDQALDFLRHNPITLSSNSERGYNIVTYQGLPLGLVKNLGTRANNLYPKEWRIRNL